MPTLSSVATRNSTPSFQSTLPSSPGLSIVERSRVTNRIYQCRAAAFRSSLRLTSHARQRAALLELQVDTVAAANCPQREVSVKPLPIIDTAPGPSVHPPVEVLGWAHQNHKIIQTVPKSVGTDETSDSEDRFDGEEVEMDQEKKAAIDVSEITSQVHRPTVSPIARSQNRPALRCVIPTVIFNSDAPNTKGKMAEPSPHSKFSADSEWSAITLTSAVSSSIGPQGKRVEDDTVLRSGPVVNTSRLPGPRARRLAAPLEVPADTHRPLSWGCGEVEIDAAVRACVDADSGPSSASSSGSSGSASFSSGSDDMASGLNTPDDDQRDGAPRLIIRIKRSNSSLNLEDGNVTDLTAGKGDIHVEKRPKFERKGYVRSGHYSKNARPRSLNLPSRSDSLRSSSASAAGRT